MMSEIIKLLIVDDSEDDRMFYKRELQKNRDTQYIVSETDSGENILPFIVAEQPACILLDYSLPGHNGIEILKHIRSKHLYIPVVMLTGQGNEVVAVSAIQEGAQNYIAKSNITSESLQRIIRIAIEHCALHKRIDEQRLSLEIFTRALAHDLKEPVRTISSFLDIISTHEQLSEKGAKHFGYIKNATERMGALIESVFMYTQLDSADKQLKKEACDVGTVLKEAEDNLHELITEHRAVITSGTMPEAHVNRMQMIQVFQNLITNAIYHNDGTPVIHIAVEEKEEHWQFSVSDNGTGINSDHIGKIFEPFKRFARHKKQGMGLGLAICKKIMELHNGKIWYETGADNGAVFIFTIPKAMPTTASKEKITPPTRLKENVTEDDKQIANILLVEDNLADVELARIILFEEAGLKCKMLVARDAYEALEILSSTTQNTDKIDLILLDINMPGMTGFELLEHLHKDEKAQQIPVIMCTTSEYVKDIETAKHLGAVGYMKKPAALNRLKPIVDTIGSIMLRPDNGGYMLLRIA